MRTENLSPTPQLDRCSSDTFQAILSVWLKSINGFRFPRPENSARGVCRSPSDSACHQPAFPSPSSPPLAALSLWQSRNIPGTCRPQLCPGLSLCLAHSFLSYRQTHILRLLSLFSDSVLPVDRAPCVNGTNLPLLLVNTPQPGLVSPPHTLHWSSTNRSLPLENEVTET